MGRIDHDDVWTSYGNDDEIGWPMDIGIIGSGKVAYQLSMAIYQADHKITFVHGRNESESRKLAQKLQSEFLDNMAGAPKVDVILIAVNDDQIHHVASLISETKNTIVCHTSGAMDISTLENYKGPKAVFYPLYSFNSKRKMNLKKVPFLISSQEKSVSTKVAQLAKSISNNVQELKDEDRVYLHLAAVYANNFGNFMMTNCFDILERQNLDKNILLPIINQSCKNWKQGRSKEVQTGPAVRDDRKTMDKHTKIMVDEDQKMLYKQLSKAITKYYK